MSRDGSLTEGLTSNFFVVSAAGEVVTANEGVLNGTVREVVLQVRIFYIGLLARSVGVSVLACARVRCTACTSATSPLGIGQSRFSLDGSLTVGLTSDFFVVSAAGEVVTANEGALNGTMREVVLQVRNLSYVEGCLGFFLVTSERGLLVFLYWHVYVCATIPLAPACLVLSSHGWPWMAR
jgi:hypothetical protein